MYSFIYVHEHIVKPNILHIVKEWVDVIWYIHVGHVSLHTVFREEKGKI